MKKIIVEPVRTFILFFCSVASTGHEIINGTDFNHNVTAITWGLIVMAIIYAFGKLSRTYL